MNAQTHITARRRAWNYYSAVSDCDCCEGKGYISNGRGMGGNDPLSFGVECVMCEATGIFPCNVCGFDQSIAGFDCLACNTVAEIPAAMLTDDMADSLAAAIKVAIAAARASA